MGKKHSAKPPSKNKPKAAAASRSAPPRVRVRMYRQGLGDCFLITFGEGATARHMLIDCGTLGSSVSSDGQKVTMAEVIKDIRTTTGGKLTILMATHEHADHLSGFNSSEMKDDQDKLRLEIEHVWLAWTEDPADVDLVPKIRRYERDLAMAAGVAALALPIDQDAVSTSSSARLRLAAESIMEFRGDPALLGADKFASTIDEAMRRVQRSGKRVTYHRPGKTPVELPEIPGFRFYVLGPPYDKNKLTELGDHGDPDLYGLKVAAQMRASEGGLVDKPDSSECERQMPFDQRYRVTDEDDAKELYPDYYSEAGSWRRIDYEWLGAASELALQLDSLTNNTSLAIAIERIEDGKVLLFPADAQLGNWRSWHAPEMRWTFKDGQDRSVEVTAQDLLKRTVFYKVGHHGSHNATARALGLGLMPDGLTAFIPVDRAIALNRNPKDSWQMPAYALLRELLKKTKGVIVRSDIGLVTQVPDDTPKGHTEAAFVGVAENSEWAEWAQHQRNATKSERITRASNGLYWDYSPDPKPSETHQ